MNPNWFWRGLKIAFLVMFALAANIHHISIDWGSSGDARVSRSRITEIRTKICNLAEGRRDWADKPGNTFTFDNYFRFLEKADSIRGDDQVRGMMAGSNCITQLQQLAKANHEKGLATNYESAQAALDSARIAHKDRTNPDWRADEAEQERKMQEEIIPAVKSWTVTTYLRWAILFFVYVLVFWRRNENIQRFGWFAALVYAALWPYVLPKSVTKRARVFGRWVWFEAKIRQAQENVWAPLSDELKQTAWQFAQGSKPISDQRNTFRQAGILPRRSFLAALSVTLILIPVTSIAQPDTSVCADESVVVVQTADFYGDTGGGGPPTANIICQPACVVSISTFLIVLKDSIKHVSRYIFFMPSPPPSEILKVPIVRLGIPHFQRNPTDTTTRHEKVFRSSISFPSRILSHPYNFLRPNG